MPELVAIKEESPARTLSSDRATKQALPNMTYAKVGKEAGSAQRKREDEESSWATVIYHNAQGSKKKVVFQLRR